MTAMNEFTKTGRAGGICFLTATCPIHTLSMGIGQTTGPIGPKSGGCLVWLIRGSVDRGFGVAASGVMAIIEDPIKALRETFEPVKRTKVYAMVASQISRLIEAGRFKPGDRLPPERDLAEMFGVSRTSVRDAIRVLEMRGLVEPRHGEGTVVTQVPIDAIISPLADALVSSKDLTADLFDMRKMLEPPLARAASVRATTEDLKAMKNILKRQAERVRAGAIAIEEDNAFHYQIATAAKNQVVLAVMDVVMDLLQESRSRSLQGPGRARKSLDGHRRILFAIRNGDPDLAAEAMRLHIEEIEQVLSLRESSDRERSLRAETPARGETAPRGPDAPSRVRPASGVASVSGRVAPGRGGVEWREPSR